jgi:hypothetical protein
MTSAVRLEDLRTSWQARCSGVVGKCAEAAAAKVVAQSNTADESADVRAARTLGVIEVTTREAAEQMAGDLSGWLGGQGLWPDKSPTGWLENDLRAAARHLPAAALPGPVVDLRLPTRSWVIAAGVGAVVGMILATPLSLLLLGQREVGIGLGGLLGAVGLVALVGWLADRPKVRRVLGGALAVSAGGTLIGGIWSLSRGGSDDLLKGSFGLGLAASVVWLTRPRMTTGLDAASVSRAVRAHLEHVADLVLAWGWAHPCRQPPETVAAAVADKLPGNGQSALAELYTDWQAGCTADNLKEMVEVLFQQLRTDGYRWEVVPHGTPFGEDMLERFEVVGRVTAGQPVRTRRAALWVGDEVSKKGELRRA